MAAFQKEVERAAGDKHEGAIISCLYIEVLTQSST